VTFKSHSGPTQVISRRKELATTCRWSFGMGIFTFAGNAILWSRREERPPRERVIGKVGSDIGPGFFIVHIRSSFSYNYPSNRCNRQILARAKMRFPRLVWHTHGLLQPHPHLPLARTSASFAWKRTGMAGSFCAAATTCIAVAWESLRGRDGLVSPAQGQRGP